MLILNLLNPPANTEKQAKIERTQIKRELLYLFAVRHAHTVSAESESIGDAIGVSVEKVEKMKAHRNWDKAWEWYVGSIPNPIDTTDGDFKTAYREWNRMTKSLPIEHYQAYQAKSLWGDADYPNDVIGTDYLKWHNQLWRYGMTTLQHAGEVMLVISLFGM